MVLEINKGNQFLQDGNLPVAISVKDRGNY